MIRVCEKIMKNKKESEAPFHPNDPKTELRKLGNAAFKSLKNLVLSFKHE